MLGYCCEHEVSDSSCRANLLLPRVPWKPHQQSEGESVTRKRQVGGKAEGQQEQTETQGSRKRRKSEARYALQTRKNLLVQLPLESQECATAQSRASASSSPPRLANKQDAKDAEDEHRRALRLGEIHPRDPWPKPTASAPPIFRAFAKEFLQYAKTHTKPGTHTFYEGCLERLLAFAAIADAPLNAITGDLASKYARHRQEVAENSIVTVNGDLRTLRRVLKIAAEWGKLDHAPAIHELPQPKGRDRVLSFKEEALYLGEGFRQSAGRNDSRGRYRDAAQQ